MRLLSKVLITRDEEYNPAGRISSAIEAALEALKLDTHNKEYVVRVTVDEVDTNSPEDSY